VKNGILTDANITGNTYVGGIVGLNDNGTVTNCHATSSVIIRAVADGAAYHGGIVGDNSGENAVVSDCFSAATLTIEGDLTLCSGYGGIVGDNYTYGGNTATVRNCIVAGATIPAYESQYGLHTAQWSASTKAPFRTTTTPPATWVAWQMLPK
jgi:hypothetical protein